MGRDAFLWFTSPRRVLPPLISKESIGQPRSSGGTSSEHFSFPSRPACAFRRLH